MEDTTPDLDAEWAREQDTFAGVAERLSVQYLLFREQLIASTMPVLRPFVRLLLWLTRIYGRVNR